MTCWLMSPGELQVSCQSSDDEVGGVGSLSLGMATLYRDPMSGSRPHAFLLSPQDGVGDRRGHGTSRGPFSSDHTCRGPTKHPVLEALWGKSQRSSRGGLGSCVWSPPSAARTFLFSLFFPCLMPQDTVFFSDMLQDLSVAQNRYLTWTSFWTFSSSRNPLHPLRNILNAASFQKPSQVSPIPRCTVPPLNSCASLFFLIEHSSLSHEMTSF